VKKKLRSSCESVMISVDKAVVSRLKKGEKKFEVLVDPMKALELRRGENIDVDEIIAFPAIYRDVRRGEIVAESELQETFGSTDVYEVAKKIILNGELQFTVEQRRKFAEEKMKEIANIISRRGVNPQTNLPHPPQRILNVMEKAGVHVDPFVDAELQVKKVLESIKPLLPIKFQRVLVRIVIPPQFVGKVYSLLKRNLERFEERWLNDGSLEATMDLPAGIQDELFKKIGDLTKGDFRSEILKRVDV